MEYMKMKNMNFSEDFAKYVLNKLAQEIDRGLSIVVREGDGDKYISYELHLTGAQRLDDPLSYKNDYIAIRLSRKNVNHFFMKHLYRAFLNKCLSISKNGHDIWVGSEGICPNSYYCRIIFMHAYENIERFNISYDLDHI